MAIRTAIPIAKIGSVMTLAAAGAGPDKTPIETRAFLVVNNAHTTLPRTVTMVVPGNTELGIANPDHAVVVAALTRVIIPILNLYKDVDRYCNWTYSDAGADLTVGVFRLS
jgi:hypothetical protein